MADFADPADHGVKIKVKEKWILGSCRRAENAVYYDDNGEVSCSLCLHNKVSKSLEKSSGEPEIRGRIETITIIEQLKSTWILRRVLEILELM